MYTWTFLAVMFSTYYKIFNNLIKSESYKLTFTSNDWFVMETLGYV